MPTGENRPPPDLVAKRLAYIDRAGQRSPDTVDVQFTHKTPQGTGPANRHNMPRLPAGQREVKNWPVLDLGDTPRIPTSTWQLHLTGACDNPTTLDWNAFTSLPQVDDVSDFHCVTTWSRMDNHWRGVRFSTLAELAIPHATARFVRTTGYDTHPGTDIPYTTNLPLSRALDPDVLLVHTWEGRPLPVEHGGPCRMITPRLYAWKGAKWIQSIEFLEADAPGFWEVRGYSNSAEPWFEDRYSR